MWNHSLNSNSLDKKNSLIQIKKWHVILIRLTIIICISILIFCSEPSSFDEVEGEIVWRDYGTEVSGVYNPKLKKIEWIDHGSGVAGMYNPNTKSVEWHDYRTGVAGVYNQNTKLIEWRDYGSGVAGVFKPK